MSFWRTRYPECLTMSWVPRREMKCWKKVAKMAPITWLSSITLKAYCKTSIRNWTKWCLRTKSIRFRFKTWSFSAAVFPQIYRVTWKCGEIFRLKQSSQVWERQQASRKMLSRSIRSRRSILNSTRKLTRRIRYFMITCPRIRILAPWLRPDTLTKLWLKKWAKQSQHSMNLSTKCRFHRKSQRRI